MTSAALEKTEASNTQEENDTPEGNTYEAMAREQHNTPQDQIALAKEKSGSPIIEVKHFKDKNYYDDDSNMYENDNSDEIGVANPEAHLGMIMKLN